MSSSDEKERPTPVQAIAPTPSKPLVLQDITSNPIEASVAFGFDHPYHPIHWSTLQKYSIVWIYCLLQVFITLTSTTYVAAEFLVEEKFGVNSQVATLGQSMFIIGTAIGPAFLGPLSDLGRKWVYVGSTLLYCLFNFGCVWPKNMAMLAIFMFIIGVCGSTSLSNVAGTIGDLFGNSDEASQPMAFFVFSANAGPSVGGVVGEAIASNSSLGLKWIFIINVIIGAAFTVALCFVPETLPRVVIPERISVEGKNVPNVAIREIKYAIGSLFGKKPVWNQVNVGDTTENDDFENAVVIEQPNVFNEIKFVAIMALKMMVTEPIITFLGLFNGFAYGLLFLYLDGIWDVFVINNGLSAMSAECTFLNFVVGVAFVICGTPIQTYLFKKDRLKNGGIPRPEARFTLSLVTVWGFPISLFWFAFTSDGNTSYWSPIIAGTLLGIADPILWLAMLNYIIDSYSEAGLSGSAIAAFTIPSFAIAGALAHAGVAMFEDMSTTWAFATLGFISLGVVVLVYVFYFFGGRFRAASKLARISGAASGQK